MTFTLTQCADPGSYTLWDSVWIAGEGVADWATGAADMGLLAADPIATAMVNLLFTDKRCPEGHPLEKYIDTSDRRGWWGDHFDVRDDLYEDELGSLLWCIENTVATDEIRRWAETLAYDALTPLLNCGLVKQLATSARIVEPSAIVLDVTVAGAVAGQPFNKNYDSIWRSRAA